MSNYKLKGIYTALFSLYDENLNVLKKSVNQLIDYNIGSGIKGFYVGGGTGECTVLPNKTRKQMLETVKEHDGDFEIIAHIGAGHFEDTMDLLEHANSVGVDAVSSLPPALTSYYSSDETYEYYKILSEKSKAPLLAYITPLLKCDIIGFVKKLMKLDNIIGIKLTIPDYHIFEQVKSLVGDDCNLLNGPDECMLAGLSMGADGAIGTTYNLMPKTACGIYNYFNNGDMKAALKCQNELNRVIDFLLQYSHNFAYWKLPLEVLDIDVGYTVFPSKILNSDEKKFVIDSMLKTQFKEETERK